jgi:hypothetical protein
VHLTYGGYRFFVFISIIFICFGGAMDYELKEELRGLRSGEQLIATHQKKEKQQNSTLYCCGQWPFYKKLP